MNSKDDHIITTMTKMITEARAEGYLEGLRNGRKDGILKAANFVEDGFDDALIAHALRELAETLR